MFEFFSFGVLHVNVITLKLEYWGTWHSKHGTCQRWGSIGEQRNSTCHDGIQTQVLADCMNIAARAQKHCGMSILDIAALSVTLYPNKAQFNMPVSFATQVSTMNGASSALTIENH